MPRRLSFRDRFFTPRVAHAVTSPSAILATGVAAAVGILAFGPIGILAGAVGYVARVGVAIPRNPKGVLIDPFAVGEPWRSFVGDALGAQRRFGEAISGMAGGPLRERLAEIGDRLDTGVDEVWNIARRGQVLAEARKRLDPDDARRDLAQLLQAYPSPVEGSPQDQTARSLQAQVDAATRMDGVIQGTVDRLRLMDARLDEMVTRAVELSVQAGSSTDLGGLGADVDGLVTEMESLRQALEDTGDRPVITLPDPGTGQVQSPGPPPAAPGT